MAVRKPWIKIRPFMLFLKLHRWFGLAAVLWLTMLAGTGIILDHHEWRWVNQWSVPSSWSSDRVSRIAPATIMRHITINETETRMVGASERGLWYSDNKGGSWHAIEFVNYEDIPQVTGFTNTATGRFENVVIGSDDGLWQLNDTGTQAYRFGLEGLHITDISAGHSDNTLILVFDQSRIAQFDLLTSKLTPINIQANVSGLHNEVPFYRVAMDLHFGQGTLAGNGSIILNDLGGIALFTLGITGVLFWWLPKRWKRKKTPARKRQFIYKWLYRLHGPTFGLIVLFPILTITVSALPMNHIYGFIGWTRDITIERSSLPPAFQATSFNHQIRGAVAFPGAPDRLLITTRFGILESSDRGQNWQLDTSLPIPPSMNMGGGGLFRNGDTVIAAFGGGKNYWRKDGSQDWQLIAGPERALTSATSVGETWYAKNSKGIYKGSLSGGMDLTDINFKSAALGTPFFLFIADVHAGIIFHPEFGYVNDIFTVLAILLALSGPIIWLRKRWI